MRVEKLLAEAAVLREGAREADAAASALRADLDATLAALERAQVCAGRDG